MFFFFFLFTLKERVAVSDRGEGHVDTPGGFFFLSVLKGGVPRMCTVSSFINPPPPQRRAEEGYGKQVWAAFLFVSHRAVRWF